MSEEKPVMSLIFEVMWALLQLHVEIFRSIVRWFIPPEPKDVSCEIILITGSGHGMGREMALRFAKLGATIICVDINPTGNEETWKMIKEKKGNAYKYECDVTNREAIFQLVDKIRRDVGEVTYLINNAGIMPCKPILRQTEKEIRTMMDVNVNANLWTIQAFLPSMIKRNHGHIVAMSSIAGLMGIRNLVPYCGSKFAVKGLMESLAIELNDDPRNLKGIKLTTVFPYMVNTGLCQKPRIKFEGLMKLVEPDEAADLIVDAVRKNYEQVSVPSYIHYTQKYILNLLPVPAAMVLYEFFNTGVDPHD